MLVDGPRKFIVQFPCDHRQEDGTQSNNAGYGDQIRSFITPYSRIDVVMSSAAEVADGLVDLIHLNRSVDQKPDIVEAKTDNLDSVFKAKSVVDQYQLIYESENV